MHTYTHNRSHFLYFNKIKLPSEKIFLFSTHSLSLFQTSPVAEMGTDRFYTRPDALASPK